MARIDRTRYPRRPVELSGEQCVRAHDPPDNSAADRNPSDPSSQVC